MRFGINLVFNSPVLLVVWLIRHACLCISEFLNFPYYKTDRALIFLTPVSIS